MGLISKIKSLAPQPKPKQPQKKMHKLMATAAHRLTPPPYEDYDEGPRTKFSSAVFVVLILHLVAAGGILAFSKIKASRHVADGKSADAAGKSVVAAGTTPAVAGGTAPVASTNSGATVGGVAVVPVANTNVVTGNNSNRVNGQPTSTTASPVRSTTPTTTVSGSSSGSVTTATSGSTGGTKPGVTGQQGTTTGVKPNGTTTGAGDSGKTYQVVKGDNPTTLAKKFGVTEEELLKVNGISDPRKLQIGQVLKIPQKKGAVVDAQR